MNTARRVEADVVKQQAQGHWLEIFQTLAPGMFEHAIKSIGTHVTCPFHGGAEDFRFLKRGSKKGSGTADCGVAMCTCGVFRDGFAVLMRARGWTFPEVLTEVDAWLNGTPTEAPKPRPAPVANTKDDKASDAKILAKVKSLWLAGRPIDLGVTPYYLKRGISKETLADCRVIRTVPSLAYWVRNGEKLEKVDSFPAILTPMQNAKGELVAIHRTFLNKSRTDKAPVPKAKKLSETPDARGAAIRLYDAKGAEVLGLTEGIETAHAVRQLSAQGYWPDLGKVPVWACYSEGNIRSFEIPVYVLATLKKIVVFADNDSNGTGLKAAMAFKERMAIEQPHIEVVVKLPAKVGDDWNDVLVSL